MSGNSGEIVGAYTPAIGKHAQTGSAAANARQGARSEYLAQYAFSAFGTCIPVPRPEDTGVDLYCTLAERVIHNLWPVSTYTVQVKSVDEPVIYPNRRSVEWLLDHPLPFFLCVVNKPTLGVKLYDTMLRFDAGLREAAPERIDLVPRSPSVPGENVKILPADDIDATCLFLGEPILEFSVPELANPERAQELQRRLATHVEQELENLLFRRMGLRMRGGTLGHAADDVRIELGYTKASFFHDEEQHQRLLRVLRAIAFYVSEKCFRGQNYSAFLLLQLFCRKYGILEPGSPIAGNELHTYLKEHYACEDSNGPYVGLDVLLSEMESKLNETLSRYSASERGSFEGSDRRPGSRPEA